MRKVFPTISSILLAGLLLAACRLAPAPAATFTPPLPTLAHTATPAATASPTLTPLASESPIPSSPTSTPRPPVERVLIISIDGLRPDAIALAPMPTLMALMQSGAYSLSAQTNFPSVTLPSHASMLLGVCPAQHGVDWNDYLPFMGYARGESVFTLAKQAGLRTVMVVGKKKLSQVTLPETLDDYQFVNDRDTVLVGQAIPLLKKGFGLAFLHFATTDDMGHNYGWLSSQQLSVVRRADEAIGSLLTALEEASLRSGTLLIVSADHGGHDQTHGSRLPEDMTIPWIANGPGIIPQTLTLAINTTDTAATVAWALGLRVPPGWVGRPITEAFGEPATLRPEPRCP